MKKMLLTGSFNYKHTHLNSLKKIGYNIKHIPDERIILDFDVSDIEVVICNSLFLYNDISKFKKLEIIQLTSAGLDRIPLKYIKENGIKVFSARGVYSIPMAEWVILKILEIYKRSRFFYINQNSHTWLKEREIIELSGKKACIIGYGSVGSEVAKRLRPFGVTIIGVDKEKNTSENIDFFFSYNSIEEALKESDIIILTVPLTKETKHLINKNSINLMKDDAIIINVSRGGIIDEKALIFALDEGKFSGVALDVFESEPLISSSPLWDFDNVLITPHNSFVSEKISERMFDTILNNLKGMTSE